MSSVYGNTGSRSADKFVVRLPDDWRDLIQARAVHQLTSMNTVILHAIERDIIKGDSWLPQVGQAVYFKDEPYIFTLTGFSGTRNAMVIHADCSQLGGRQGLVTDFEPVKL